MPDRPLFGRTVRYVLLSAGVAFWITPGIIAQPAGDPTITTEAEGQNATGTQAGQTAAAAPAATGERILNDAQSPDSLQYGRTRQLVRKSGFGDLEIDLLHGRIARNLAGVMLIPDLKTKPDETDPKSYRDFWELIATSDNRLIAKGKDIHGDPFLRLTLREGSSFSTDIFPVNYVFRAHCYLFPNPETGELDRIIFQFYRVNYTGSQYGRELRRLIHPNPKDMAKALEKEQTEAVELLNNSDLTLEFYEAASSVKPVWEGSDGIPLPDLSEDFNPVESVYLNKPETPLDYEEQTRIIVRYKRLLRAVDGLLYTRLRSHELNREIIIERLLDFPS